MAVDLSRDLRVAAAKDALHGRRFAPLVMAGQVRRRVAEVVERIGWTVGTESLRPSMGQRRWSCSATVSTWPHPFRRQTRR